MTHFGITLEGKVCMDIGASTGGFTDCMLQNGAVKVYAVDDMVSLRGNCGRMNGLSVWKRQTSVM